MWTNPFERFHTQDEVLFSEIWQEGMTDAALFAAPDDLVGRAVRACGQVAPEIAAALMRAYMSQQGFAQLQKRCQNPMVAERAAESMATGIRQALAVCASERQRADKLQLIGSQIMSLRQQLVLLLQQPCTENRIVRLANKLDRKLIQYANLERSVRLDLARKAYLIQKRIESAVVQALQETEHAVNILAAWGSQSGKDSRRDAALLAQVKDDAYLREIARYLGRYRKMVQCKKAYDVSFGRGENYDIETGRSLTRCLPGELGLLSTPDTLPLFLKKYAEGKLKQYRKRERIQKGQGDVIVCLDESDSTRGDKAAWGKAVALALLEVAQKEGRRYALIHFSSERQIRTDFFLPEDRSPERKLEVARHFWGGGTNFDAPIREAFRLVETEGFTKADIAFITDGICTLSSSLAKELPIRKTVHKVSIAGVLMDKGEYMKCTLEPFCDCIYRTSLLDRDDIARRLLV